MTAFPRLLFAGLALLALLAAVPAAAQEERATGAVPNAFQGLGLTGDEQLNVEADAAEVREQEQMVVFTGNVIVRQGALVLQTATLRVFYTAPEGDASREVSRVEAEGGVLVTSADQTASGDAAVFDVATNTVTVTGNVVLTQGDNVVRGPRLVIDVVNGNARMEGGRVQMLFEPGTLEVPAT